ncbi:hypothetical protein [Fusobacterium sp.]|uniref:hypothetical protein n=1 Tax=Fusobacterium sp. TaxID=68766 RepID=UPI002624C8CE|nr:hypothetical protein [Fusobacterium sp.]
MNGKKLKKIALLTYENFESEIQNILLNSNVEYLVMLYFTSNMAKNTILLENTKKYFFNSLKDIYMKNIVIISQKEYLANDICVKGIIVPKDMLSFDYFKFTLVYENTDYNSIDDFLKENASKFNYNLDLYNENSSWIYFQNKTGILIINKDTKNEILKNYHKVKFFTPEIILAVLGEGYDEEIIKLLKLIGADAHITIGFINKMAIPYTKRTDSYFFIEDSNFEQLGREFINEFLNLKSYPNGIVELKNFLNIPDKNFEADMNYDEEREINKKEIKYYSLKLKNGDSLKKELLLNSNELIFNTGLAKKYLLKKL